MPSIAYLWMPSKGPAPLLSEPLLPFPVAKPARKRTVLYPILERPDRSSCLIRCNFGPK